MENWIGIGIAFLFLGLGVGMTVDTYQKGQCRVAAIEKGFGVEDINKLCK